VPTESPYCGIKWKKKEQIKRERVPKAIVGESESLRAIKGKSIYGFQK